MRAFAPVPSYAAERVREHVAGGFRFVESRNFRTVPLHAHERATLTFVLGGALEESYAAAPLGRRRGGSGWRPRRTR